MKFKLCSYNIKWFSRLFDGSNNLVSTDEPSQMYEVTKEEQLQAIAAVLQSLDADIYCIVEGPNTNRTGRDTVVALENFATHFGLKTNKALVGLASPTEQEICLLYNPDKVQASFSPKGTEISCLTDLSDFFDGKKLSPSPRFDQHYIIDIEEDSVQEVFTFERAPLEATIQLLNNGSSIYEFELIGVHAKSKIVSGVSEEIYSKLNSISNRRKLIAQCQWIRDRVEELLAENKNVAVMGDFNDGPGLDFYERQFGKSAVEITIGDIGDVSTLLRNPFTKAKWSKSKGWSPSTARFFQFDSRRNINVLLDFILLSPNMAEKLDAEWRIWHPYENSHEIGDLDLKNALKKASDHYPVTVDLDFEDLEIEV